MVKAIAVDMDGRFRFEKTYDKPRFEAILLNLEIEILHL